VPPPTGGERTEHLCPSPTQRTHGFLVDLGDRDRGAVARAHQPSELECVAAGWFDPISRFLREQRGRNDPAAIAFVGQIAREPRSTRTSFVDKDEAGGRRLQLPHTLSEVALAWADGAEIDDVSTIVLGGIGNRDGCFLDIQSKIKRARLCHG
jgi:hypothetical protein